VVGQVLGAVEELAAGAADVGAAVDPHHHWQRRPEGCQSFIDSMGEVTNTKI
jgi:hypothetical protein